MSQNEKYIPLVDAITGEFICWVPEDLFKNWTTDLEIRFIEFLRNLRYNNSGLRLEV
jgi:hypothetical protein